MAVKIRLQRIGTKKKPFYRVVAIDERSRRNGSIIEQIGQYQPIVGEKQFNVDEEKMLKWLKLGAQPTVTILNLLKNSGIWQKFKAAK
ncbi:MAG TPA: 30S ribosomal protein S16 [Spirochaetota bacterium]|nr:30S ribosomal protein S16 [Spirochaetota bacterium]HRZ27614.1 30S ribosomal protein S16 [Spirochaetota bacterium]HSA13621.1 30S ribosomal protein S16 [Spirochaetota bacterium]